jgi:hypothetical protein
MQVSATVSESVAGLCIERGGASGDYTIANCGLKKTWDGQLANAHPAPVKVWAGLG